MYSRPAFILPAALTAIEADAFQGISAIAVQIPASVTSISDNLFTGSSMQYIYGFTELVKSFAEDNGYIFVPVREWQNTKHSGVQYVYAYIGNAAQILTDGNPSVTFIPIDDAQQASHWPT